MPIDNFSEIESFTDSNAGAEKTDDGSPPSSGLLTALWRDPDHAHFFGTHDRADGIFKTVQVEGLSAANETAKRLAAQNVDVFFACACFGTGDGRKQSNAIGAHAFWMDIDCGAIKDDQAKGYADIMQASTALAGFCARSGLPKPSRLISSGGGLHAYWELADLVPKEAWCEYAQKLKVVAAKDGFLADPSRTADIASLLRVPGTLNHKYDPPRLVDELTTSATPIENAVMLGAIDSAWTTHCCAVAASATPFPVTSLDDAATLGARANDSLDLQLLESALTVLDPDCDEHAWKFHRIAPLARAAVNDPAQAADLTRLAMRWSRGDLRGKQSKAWVTPGQSNGKTGEQIFNEVWARFSDTDYKGKTATVGTIFFHAREQGWKFPAAPTPVGTKKPVIDVGSAATNLPFPEVAPYSEPVDPAALLEEVRNVILRFIVMEPEQADAAALWIAQTYLTADLEVSALALIDAAERACAKTLLQTLIASMSFRPLAAANASLSALFRAIERWGCTLFIDEADTFFKENKELHGMVNAGYKKGGAVLRSEVSGNSYEPRAFNVYGAKSIAGITLAKHLPDSTMSRGIVFTLRRKKTTEKVDRMRSAEPGLFARLASQYARFAQDYAEQIRTASPDLPDELSDRSQDNWEPLLAIASCAGPQWVARATAAALKMSVASEAQGSASNDLLADMREVLRGHLEANISTTDLIEKLSKHPDMDWETYYRGKPITSRQLAKYLSVYDLKPRTARQKNGKTPKGYYMAELQDVFARYLKPLEVEVIEPLPKGTPPTPRVAATAPQNARQDVVDIPGCPVAPKPPEAPGSADAEF